MSLHRFPRLLTAFAVATSITLGFIGIATADQHEVATPGGSVPQATEEVPSTANRPLPEFFEGVRATGAGSSHTAITSGVDSLYQNPAGMARAPMYILDSAFSYTPQGAIVGAGIADSKLNPDLAMAVSWNYFFGLDDHEHLSGHDARAGIGVPIIPEQVSIGAGIRYLRITDESIPILDEDDDQLLINGVTFDAGINFRVADTIHLGLRGQNLIDRCADDGRCRGSTPTRITGGFGVGYETTFLLSGETTLDLTSGPEPMFDFAVGGEYLMGYTVPLRVGFERRAFLDRNLLTFGIGWRSEQMGLDASYRHDVGELSEFGYLSGSISVYF